MGGPSVRRSRKILSRLHTMSELDMTKDSVFDYFIIELTCIIPFDEVFPPNCNSVLLLLVLNKYRIHDSNHGLFITDMNIEIEQ